MRYWERPKTFMALNPSGLTPVLVEQTGDQKVVVCEIRAILEHLETVAPEHDLLGATAADRAEARGV